MRTLWYLLGEPPPSFVAFLVGAFLLLTSIVMCQEHERKPMVVTVPHITEYRLDPPTTINGNSMNGLYRHFNQEYIQNALRESTPNGFDGSEFAGLLAGMIGIALLVFGLGFVVGYWVGS